jgi:YHS domain-containing protein
MGLYRIFFYALLFYVIFKLVRFFSSLNKRSRSSQPKQKVSGKMVHDKICNTYLPVEDAIKEIHNGNEYFFCSETCRQKFLQNKN